MSDMSIPYPELLAFCIALSDGSISDADFAKLDAVLAEDAKARAFYLEFMRTSAMLEQRAASQQDAQDDKHELDLEDGLALLGLELDETDRGALTLKDAEQLLAAPEGDTPLVDLTDELRRRSLDARERENAKRRHPLPTTTASRETTRAFVIPQSLVWLSAAAVLGLLASVVWLSQQKTGTSPPPQSVAERETDPQAAPVAPLLVAIVTASLDARLTNGRAITPGTQVYDSPLDLAQGIIQLELTSGVTLTLEGPARLDLGTDMFVALDHGKIVGVVPEQAHGFVVRTPTIDVVDLGTEFGITVGLGNASEVHVFDGSVRVEPGQYAQQFTPVIVEAGDARGVTDAGLPSAIDAAPGTYYRQVPSAYERMVRDAEPLVYWRFDSQGPEGQLAGLGMSQAALSADRAVDLRRDTPPIHDPAGRALWLGRSANAIHTEQAIDLDTGNGFTVEAWVWVPSGTDRRMRIISNNGRSPEGQLAGGYGLGVSALPPDRHHDKPVLMFTGYSVFDAFSQAPVPTDRWVHVSASLDDQGVLRMTIDGQSVLHRIEKDTGYAQIPGYVGQVAVLPSEGPTCIGGSASAFADLYEHWSGGLDEVVVYPHVVGPETLSAHARPGLRAD